MVFGKKGFTLIELMVTMAVMALLVTVVLYAIKGARAAARDVARQKIINGVQAALTLYYRDNQSYPVSPGASDWACTLYILKNCGYITSNPVDPSTPKTSSTDLACASGGSGGNGACGGTITCYNWGGPTLGSTSWCSGVDSAGTPWPAGYSLTSSAQSYTITLTKESGGTSVFNSAQ